MTMQTCRYGDVSVASLLMTRIELRYINNLCVGCVGVWDNSTSTRCNSVLMCRKCLPPLLVQRYFEERKIAGCFRKKHAVHWIYFVNSLGSF